MVQNLYKKWLLVSKVKRGIWITSDKQCKVQKVETQWATSVQKIHSFIKTLYTEDLSNITFNYCEYSPNFLCYFWNHKSFFTAQLISIFSAQTLHTKISHQSANFQIFHCSSYNSPNYSCHFSKKQWVFLQSLDHSSVSWEITLLHFLAENLYAIEKRSTSKCKFSDLSLLILKFTKFVMSFLQPRASLSSNFA